MRHTLLRASFATTLVSLAAAPVWAQALDLPRPSPAASVTQQVGLTDISVEYSSPAVKGRKIWGGLVPYGKMWRSGANASTKVNFSKDVNIGGTAVPAGTYALLTIPTNTTWTVIFNKDTGIGGNTGAYQQDKDVARLTVRPKMGPHRERLTFLFANTTDDETQLDLEWEKLRVTIPIKVNTTEQALANIKSVVGNTWRTYANAARYHLDTKKDLDAGLGYANQSLALKEDWFNLWIKAQLLAAKGQTQEAHALAEKANQLGSQNPQGFFMAADVQKALSAWKPKK